MMIGNWKMDRVIVKTDTSGYLDLEPPLLFSPLFQKCICNFYSDVISNVSKSYRNSTKK
jgi:hypothetical protein